MFPGINGFMLRKIPENYRKRKRNPYGCTKPRSDIKKEIDESLAIANAEPEIIKEELNDIFKPFNLR
jgi:hypothetical protein